MKSRPRGIICFICGKEYGTSSIDIHLKTCRKKFEQQEMEKPKASRRQVPDTPEEFEILKNNKGKLSASDI